MRASTTWLRLIAGAWKLLAVAMQLSLVIGLSTHSLELRRQSSFAAPSHAHIHCLYPTGNAFARLFQMQARKKDNVESGNDSFEDRIKRAVYLEKEAGSDANRLDDDAPRQPQRQNNGLRRLAQLSLEDYKWRTSLFKTREANRKVEESLARMFGDEATYVRPMDAGEKKIGPLGRAEKIAVDWLESVIDEEGRRAEQIVNSEGSLVRPKDAVSPDGQLGPLGFMEKEFVDFLYKIRTSEKERARTNTLRPKDLDESLRGPLGEAEICAISAIREVLDSERLRMMQSRARGGEVVRPIDVPGPLGEFEMALLDVVKSEQQRGLDREDSGKLVVRPMDSSRRGPLGKLELKAVEAVENLTKEEKERLRNIQIVLERNRPMQQEKPSALGIFEAAVVAIARTIGFFVGFFGQPTSTKTTKPTKGKENEPQSK